MMIFNKANVRRYMRANLGDHRDPVTHEINATGLAEDAAAAFEVNGIGGPLDDETHWIWDLAVDLAG